MEELKAWLQAHRSEVVGRAGWASSCPLLGFLEASRGIVVDHVDQDLWREKGKRFQPLPLWASAFVMAIDRQFPHGAHVTGEQALSVVASLEKAKKYG